MLIIEPHILYTFLYAIYKKNLKRNRKFRRTNWRNNRNKAIWEQDKNKIVELETYKDKIHKIKKPIKNGLDELKIMEINKRTSRNRMEINESRNRNSEIKNKKWKISRIWNKNIKKRNRKRNKNTKKIWMDSKT